MLSWLPDIDPLATPKYAAIAEALAAAIRSGKLKPGERLPPQRALAQALSVDLTTVTRAFSEVQRAGLIEANAGRGSHVRAMPGLAASPSLEPAAGSAIDLNMNLPPSPPAARLEARIGEGIAAILAGPAARHHLAYQESGGALAEREAGAAWLAPRLGPVPVQRLVLAAGTQSVLAALLPLLLQPGEVLCLPAQTYPGLISAAERAQARLLPLPSDAEGLIPEAFEEVCRRDRPKALYCVPNIANPTTATLPLARREAIVAIARRQGVAIIEDDAYGALPEAPPPQDPLRPLARLAPEITWHIATLSKCATPALRVAFAVAPDLSGALALASELRVTTMMAPPLMSALAARWIGDGTMAAVTEAIAQENMARQALAADLLRGLDVAANPAGPHLWLRLPPGWRRSDVVVQARASGLSLVPSDAFAAGESAPEEAIRIALGAAGSRAQLREGLSLVAALLSRAPRGRANVV